MGDSASDFSRAVAGKVLAVVPARGGSKGIPRKNLARASGRSLLEWTVAAALGARCQPRVVVSTDSVEIAAAARGCGAEVPFMRPSELASDESSSLEVALHALDFLEQAERYRPAWLLLLQPTSPLREARDIDESLELAAARNADAVVGVCRADHHPSLLRVVAPDGRAAPVFATEAAPSRRQDMSEVQALNGAIYLIKPAVLRAERTWYPERTFAHVMERARSLDVDEPWQLLVADALLAHRDRPTAGGAA